MRIDVIDSPLRCPYDGKRMVMELSPNETEAEREHEAKHTCWHCGYTEIETGRTMPLASTTQPILAKIRDKIRSDEMGKPIRFEWPAFAEIEAGPGDA